MAGFYSARSETIPPPPWTNFAPPGSGSQIMAGEANGRRVFAMEISPAYVDVAVERWQAETGRDAILDGDGRTFAAVKAERLDLSPTDEEAAA